ncbi:hypothetical protein BDB01DRAFT_776801 [Pilobolus umbonatus]|nr:hypothetical protein BDB01DRAFT_776801 [Pilobolus umbonatus]
MESQLIPLAEMATQFGKIGPVCVDAYARYHCSKAYPRCITNNNELDLFSACTSLCEQANKECAPLLKVVGAESLLLDCPAEVVPSTGIPLQPDEICNQIPTQLTEEQSKKKLDLSGIPPGFIISQCPAPFIADPLAEAGTDHTEDEIHCKFGCCIPCPTQNYFYKENWAIRGFMAADIIRFISAMLTLVLVVSYLVLPDKRRHPSLLILNLSVSLFLFSIPAVFALGDPKRLQCAANGITAGQMGNNTLCAVQGAILIFGSLATCLWTSALILNLHVHTVWNSVFFTNKYYIFNVFCWGIPVAITATALGLHSVKFEFANLCLVSMEKIFPLFFYPLAAIVCPSFLIHAATFFYIAKIAVREGLESEMSQSLSMGNMTDRPQGVSRKHVLIAIKIQWRALLLAVIAIFMVLFYWLFYMTQMKRVNELKDNPAHILRWLECMLTPGNNQNMCSSILSPHLPPFALMITAEVLVSSIGIFLFFTFGKRSLWREWNDWIYDTRIRLMGRNRGEKQGEQFYAL